MVDKLIKRKEAAEMLGISLDTLDHARMEGLITYVQYVENASVDPKTVQYLAGHENSKVTMDIYAKVKYNKPAQLHGVINRAIDTSKKD